MGVLGVQGRHVVVTFRADRRVDMARLALPGLRDGVHPVVPQNPEGGGHEKRPRHERHDQDGSDQHEEPDDVPVAGWLVFHGFLRKLCR